MLNKTSNTGVHHLVEETFPTLQLQDLVHTFCSMIKPEVCIEAGRRGLGPLGPWGAWGPGRDGTIAVCPEEWVKYCGWGAAFIHRCGKAGAETLA